MRSMRLRLNGRGGGIDELEVGAEFRDTKYIWISEI